MATVLDTHQAVKDLEAAGADPALAEAFVRVVQRGGEADLAQLGFACSRGPAGDEQKALEEAGGDSRALRVGP